MKKKRYEYKILVNNKLIWKGLDPGKVFDKICKKHPKDKIAIKWESPEAVLIA